MAEKTLPKRGLGRGLSALMADLGSDLATEPEAPPARPTPRPEPTPEPLGARAEQELRRFLLARHVPRFDRDRLPLLVDANDRILWVPGADIAEPARLMLNTRRCVEVRVTTA